ncbi:spore cortex biosynthesis protein YabQ [Sutcliffiella deserti]|uniref:spore cortex biosynthesis protein YabQ n=1 Tax=Sutcliffiella deserti TaxID=2875501 RepID=UPI001CC08216|nr:spore cortex biosynthesis protein YabQ [Sutcliffiella deserti]
MTLTTQFYTMLAMVGVGSYLGAAVDTYGRFMKREKRARWIVFLHDLLFWLMQGLVTFYVLLKVNEGEVRFYIFIAIVCGYAAYQSILRYFYLSLLESTIQLSISFYQLLEKIVKMTIIKPIQLLVQAIIFILLGTYKVVYSIVRFLLILIWKIIKILTLPIQWVFMLLWKLLPKSFKKYLEILFRKIAGFFSLVKNRKHSIINRVKEILKKR